MSSSRFIATLLLLTLAMGSTQAKPHTTDWANMQSVPAGTTVVVEMKSGDRYVGDVKSVDPDNLVLLVRYSRSARKAVELNKNDVLQVRKKSSPWLGPAIGAAIGFGVGLGIGAAVDRPGTDDPGLGKALFAPLGGLIGFGAGRALPMKGKKIYVAP